MPNDQGRKQGGVKFLGTTSAPFININLSKLGYPGSKSELHVLAQAPGEHRTDSERLYDTSKRQFVVSARLSKAPIGGDTIKGDFTEQDGNSYFLLAHQAMRVALAEGAFEIRKNAKGEVSIATMICIASTVGEARSIFLKATTQFLDHVAYIATCPVYIVSLRIEDVINMHVAIEFFQPYGSSLINETASFLPLPLKPAYALYREGISSNSELYKFLCLYKILDRYFSKLKPALYKAFLRAGADSPKAKDLVPEHQELPQSVRPYVGKSIKSFMDEILTPKFRDVVAHFQKEGESPLVTSDPDNLARYEEILLSSELCARTVIKNYEEAFRVAQAKGVDLTSLTA